MSADLDHRVRFNPAVPAEIFTPVEVTLIRAGQFPAADRKTCRRP